MRVDVKKFLFVGTKEDKETFFRKAQEAGFIHFIDPKKGKTGEISQEIQDTSAAIKVLRTLPVMEQEEKYDYENASDISTEILNLHNKLEQEQEQERILRLEMGRMEPLGNFSLEDIAWIEKEGNRKVQFYYAKEGFAEEGKVPENVFYLTSAYNLDYFLGVNTTPEQYEKMIEIKSYVPYGELKSQYRELENEIHELEVKLKGYAKYSEYLHHALIYQLNQYNLLTAESYVQLTMEDKIFAVEGWVPVDKVEQLDDITKRLHVHSEEIAIEPEDAIPTHLENEGLARVGEDLVHIYDTPSIEDKDPSLWVLFFFPLFFSMIIGDAGYGLVFLLVALYIKFKTKKFTKLGKRILTLFFILSFFTIAWGLLTTSFFGIKFAPDSPIRKVSLVTWLAEKKAEYHFEHKDAVYKEWVKKEPELANAKSSHEFLYGARTVNEDTGLASYDIFDKFSDNIMLELALFIGTLHIVLSLLRYVRKNPTAIGWVIFIIGAYLYFPTFLETASLIHYAFGVDEARGARDGIILMIGGMSLAVGISVFKNRLMGLLEGMNVIQIFSDVLSYLRLYALGLSGSLLTATMTDLALGMNLVFATLLLVATHVVNIVLSIMGGVIHGLRLNFLEWYHYSFEGGGKKFNPLQKKEIE